MKSFISKMMICSVLASGVSQTAMSSNIIKDPSVITTSLPFLCAGTIFSAPQPGGDIGGLCVFFSVPVTGIYLLLSATLLKEMHEVSPDAANYVATGEASLTLQSVVEKFQESALEQGQELSFDEAVDAINTIGI